MRIFYIIRVFDTIFVIFGEFSNSPIDDLAYSPGVRKRTGDSSSTISLDYGRPTYRPSNGQAIMFYSCDLLFIIYYFFEL